MSRHIFFLLLSSGFRVSGPIFKCLISYLDKFCIQWKMKIQFHYFLFLSKPITEYTLILQFYDFCVLVKY